MRKKMKQALGVLLSLALVLGMMPGMGLTSYAEEGVTEVTTADELQAAVNDGKQTIKLTDNIDVSGLDGGYGDLIVNGTLTIDLNGFGLSTTGTYGAIYTEDGANLTITDSSETKSGSITGNNNCGLWHNAGVLNISGGTVRGFYGIIHLGGELNFSDGKAIGTGSIYSTGGTLNISGGALSGNETGVLAEGEANVNVTDGSIKAARYGIFVEKDASANIKVSGGIITDGEYGIFMRGGTLDVNGGFIYGSIVGAEIEDNTKTVKVTNGEIGGGQKGFVVTETAASDVDISGGVLWCMKDGVYAVELSNSKGNAVISGGSYRGIFRVDAKNNNEVATNVTIEGGCFEKNFNTANDSKPIIKNGEFWGKLTQANSGPTIQGGVYAFEKSTIDDYVATDYITKHLDNGYSIVSLSNATFQVGDVTGEFKYGVIPAPTLNISAENSEKEYDGAGVDLNALPEPAIISAKGAAEEKTYIIAWAYQWTKDPDTTELGTDAHYATGPNVADSGSYICKAVSASTELQAKADVSINKAAPTVTAPEPKKLIFNEKAQELVTAGKAEGGEMQYALGKDASTAPTSEWKTTVPAETEVGTYYVWYTVVGDANHKDTEPACVTSEIQKASEPVQEEPVVEPIEEPVVEPAKSVPMHRLFNPATKEHLYTADANEKAVLSSPERGWVYEGVGWYAAAEGDPVYRLYNPYSHEHLYTRDANERKVLISAGWNDEGIGWYSDPNKGVPVYRMYSPVLTTGTHHYTSDVNENNVLIKRGAWKDEGIGWYGIK